MTKKKVKTFYTFNGKQTWLKHTGFYFAHAETEKKDKVFVFYAISDDNKEQITAYIPAELVCAELAEALTVVPENTSEVKE